MNAASEAPRRAYLKARVRRAELRALGAQRFDLQPKKRIRQHLTTFVEAVHTFLSKVRKDNGDEQMNTILIDHNLSNKNCVNAFIP